MKGRNNRDVMKKWKKIAEVTENEVSISKAKEKLAKAEKKWKEVVEYGRELYKKELLDRYNIEIERENPKIKWFWKK